MPIRWFLLLSLLLSTLSAGKYGLGDLCQNGIEYNPRIQSFKHRTSASNSVYDQSIDQYKPHFNIEGEVGQQRYTLGSDVSSRDYDGRSQRYNVSVRQSIYRATLLEAMTDAEERTVLAKLIEEDEKAKLVTQILQSAFELVKLQKSIEILTQKEDLLHRAYKNIEKKHALKLASKVDKYQSLSMLKQSQSDLAITRQMYDHMLYNLKLLTKIDNVKKYVKNLRFNIASVKKAFKKANLKHIISQYKESTRVKLERQTVKISKVQIDLRSSERYPSVDAVVSYGDSGGTLDATVRQNDSRAMITVKFPFYQGGYVTDRVEEARYLALSAQSNAEDIEMNIKISLEKAIQDIRSGLESVDAEAVAVKASRQYFKAASESYINGLGSLTDAYLAEADYQDNRLRLNNAESRIFNSLAEIYYLSGISDYHHVKKLQKKYFK
jgi:outer membrane protein